MCDDDDLLKCHPSSNRECRPGGPSSKRRAQSLSATILDYYNRYGQNRDLEKYFRYRSKHSSHHGGHRSTSSDESCLPPNILMAEQKSASASQLPGPDEAAALEASGAAGSADQRKTVSANELSEIRSPRLTLKDAKGNPIGMESESKDCSTNIPVVDIKKKKTSKGKKGCNMSSTIEISMNVDMGSGRGTRECLEHSATQTSQTILSPPRQLADAATETTYIEPFSRSVTFVAPIADEDEDDEPQSMGAAQALRPSSANSSIVSMGMPNKPRLEWDSLGDVGYDKSVEANGGALTAASGGSVQNMSTFERATLRKFFAERGLVFDENLAAIEDPKLFGAKLREIEGQNETQDRESTLATTMTGGDDGGGDEETADGDVPEVEENRPKDGERPAEATLTPQPPPTTPQPTPSSPSTQPADDAYHPKASNESMPEEESLLDTNMFQNAGAFSTPISGSDHQQQRVISVVSDSIDADHKACQTRRPSVASKEVQMDDGVANPVVMLHKNTSPICFQSPVATDSESSPQPNDTTADTIQPSMPSYKPIMSTSSDSHQFESRTSFEYIAAPELNNDNENIAPNSVGSLKASSSKASSHRSKTSSRKSLTEAIMPNPESHVSSKSAITESSKPPQPSSKQKSIQTSATVDVTKYDSQTEEIIQTILCSTTSNQSTTLTNSTVNSESPSTLLGDLRHGIQLLDSLVESEKLNKATKKRLVKKIVKGLLKAKFSISSGTTSASSSAAIASVNTTKPSSRNSEKNTTSSPLQQHQAPTARSTSADRSMQWLKPMTKSELDFEKRKRNRATKESLKLDWIQEEIKQLLSLQSFVLKQQKARAQTLNPLYANDSRDMSEEYYCSVGGKHRDSSTSTYASTKDSKSVNHNKLGRVKQVQNESSDSPVIIDRFVRNRSKLRTPDGCSDTLGTYARSKQNHFLKQYHSSQERLARDLVYTQPYGNQFVAPIKQTRTPTAVPTNTVSTSSNTFLSSGSISIPDMPSSAYPDKPLPLRSSIAVQTTDSLRRRTPNHTEIPPSRPIPQPPISYTISFGRTPQFGAAPILKTTPTPTTMQDHLQRRKPTFLASANARRECIHEMNRLRQQRNVQRQKLFVLLDDPGELITNLQLIEPPPPLTQCRVFTTRQLKEATRQRYDQLPEIRAKEEAQKQRRIRNGQRVMREMFSRDLQRRTLRGRVNLSNSRMVTGNDGMS